MSSTVPSTPHAPPDADWREVDPRVKWAIDAFDFGDFEPSSLLSYWGPVAFCGALGGAIRPLTNMGKKRPLWSALPLTALYTAVGLGLGVYYREWRMKRNAEEVAVIKHYIMTHPEQFPEPERVKLGDKVVFFPWKCAR